MNDNEGIIHELRLLNYTLQDRIEVQESLISELEKKIARLTVRYEEKLEDARREQERLLGQIAQLSLEKQGIA